MKGGNTTRPRPEFVFFFFLTHLGVRRSMSSVWWCSSFARFKARTTSRMFSTSADRRDNRAHRLTRFRRCLDVIRGARRTDVADAAVVSGPLGFSANESTRKRIDVVVFEITFCGPAPRRSAHILYIGFVVVTTYTETIVFTKHTTTTRTDVVRVLQKKTKTNQLVVADGRRFRARILTE